ncbi:MAG TPA: FtsX-like permease family protein [Atribacterota bacterium]|nr:FtsX-like permease family protein [Atribacterota bacterium]
MFSIRLALKNLSRHKRRNLITIFVIGFAFFGYLFAESIMNGMEEMSFDNIKDFETGDVQIANPQYWQEKEDFPLVHLMEWNDDFKDRLAQRTGVEGISPEMRFSALLNNGIDEMGVIGLGVIPQFYNSVFKTRDYVIDGSMLSLEENKAVIGQKLAELMDLKLNDYIVLLVRTKEDTFNTIDVEIGGIIRTLNPILNSTTVFLPLELVQQRLNVGDGITGISLKIDPGQEKTVLHSLADEFYKKNLPLSVYSWQESAQNVIALGASKKSGIAAIMSVVLLIGMVGIVNNVILSALERTSEIGMMKALGMREWEVVFVFMVEATGIGILGGLLGCLLGFIGVNWLVNNGLNFARIMGEGLDWSEYGVPVLERIYGVWNYPAFSYIFLLGVIVAMLSSIVPSYWAAHKDPVEAIYHR